MQYQDSSKPQETKRSVVSEEILQRMEKLANSIQMLKEKSESRLDPIIMNKLGSAEKGQTAPVPAYPPLFDRMRNMLKSMEDDVSVISNTINSVEI